MFLFQKINKILRRSKECYKACKNKRLRAFLCLMRSKEFYGQPRISLV